MAQHKLSDPGPAKKSGKKKAHKAKSAKKAGAAKTASRSGKKGIRAKLKGYAGSATGKAVLADVVSTGEILIAGAAASAVQGYRKASGLRTRLFNDMVDWRVLGGVTLHGLGLLAQVKGYRVGTHLLNAGTGVLASFVLDKAAEWGASKAAAPSDAAAKGTVVGRVEEVGAARWPWRKGAKEERLKRRQERLRGKQADVRQELAEEKADQPSRARKGGTRRTFVLPQGIEQDGRVVMPAGRYQKVGVLADY